MLSLQQIEQDLQTALKARDSLTANTLRGLKTRIINEQIAKLSSKGEELPEQALFSLVRSEIKKCREAEAGFQKGGRPEMAEKEAKEILVLEKYLPAQMPEQQILSLIESLIQEHQFTAKDFGKAMGMLKSRAGAGADGALLARLLKERLK